MERETTHDDISDDLRARLQDLARVHDVEPGDLRDEHERWALYDLTMRREAGLSRLFDLLPMEPEAAVVSSVVVQMLERATPDERSAWLERVPESSRDYALKRKADLEIVDALCQGSLRSEEVARSVDDWSDWLQRRITVHVEDVAVLEIMAERGRTKRVRRQAAEALRDLRP